jgi:4-amino-4-deoxy-L-arabinose transferase-like glycosyltransferase
MLSPLSTLGSAWPADRVPSPATAATSRVSTALWTLAFLAALGIRLVLLHASAGVEPRIVDEQHYHQLATNLVRGDGFGWSASQPTSIRPPLYPMLVAAIWYAAGSDGLQAVRGAQIVLAALSAWLLYLITARLFDRSTGALAALALAFYPTLIFSGVLLLTEVLFVTLLLTAVHGCLVLLQRNSWRVALGTGLAFGAAALTRSILWPFPFVLVLFLALALRGSVRQRAALCAVLLLGFAIVVGPWSVRNTRLQRTFTAVDTMGGLNLLMGNYQYTPEARMWDAISQTGVRSWSEPLRHLTPPAGGWTEGTKDHWAQRQALAFMAANPRLTARRSAIKFADLWGLEREWVSGLQRGLYQPPVWFAVVSSAAVLIAFPVILIAAIVGIFLAPPAERRAHWFFVLLIAYVCALQSLTFGHSRYHLPLVPILIVYAASAVTRSSEVMRRLRSRAAIAPALGLGLAALDWGHEVLVRDADKIAELIRLLRNGT